MATRTLKELPSAKELQKSQYDLELIRSKLSGVLEQKIQMRDSGVLDLILCLANEIAELKEEVKQLKERYSID